MSLSKIYANLSCSELATSTAWYERLFGRTPDARPMGGLVEWHHGDDSGFQLFQNPDHAGKCTLTLIVKGLPQEQARLAREGLKPGEIEHADYVDIIRLHDLDHNLVVLAEPRENAQGEPELPLTH